MAAETAAEAPARNAAAAVDVAIDLAALEVGEAPLSPATLQAVQARLARIEG